VLRGCAAAAAVVIAVLPGALGVWLGVALIAGLGWVGVRARAARQARERVSRLDADVPPALDLVAAGLRCGLGMGDALRQAVPAAGAGEVLSAIGVDLASGADAAAAWARVSPQSPLAPLARAAVRSAASGSRVAAAFENAATTLRADLAAEAEARAQRVAVLAMVPLGVCFLPAFVCIAVVPSVLGMLHTALPP
jgi:Flp pilus assembly protein TadB